MTDHDPRILEGIRLLRARQWYTAHEALESVWLVARGDERAFLQALIHVAVSFEHLSRGNPRGAASQWQKAGPKLLLLGTHPFDIDVDAWRAEIEQFFAAIDLERRARKQTSGAAPETLPDESTWPVPAT